jgi:hypothetical protein
VLNLRRMRMAKLKRYKVMLTVPATVEIFYEVQAKDEDAARKMVETLVGEADYNYEEGEVSVDWTNTTTDEITEIEEIR